MALLARHVVDNGYRLTESRELLAREILRIPRDFTEADVLHVVRQNCMGMSSVSVRRTLDLLLESGLLLRSTD